MTHRYRTLPVFFLAVAVVMVGCDQSSLNNEPNYGDEYIISQNNSAVGDAVAGSFAGSAPNPNPTVIVPDTVDFFVEGYTTEKSYTWTVNGNEVPAEESAQSSYVWSQRGGEFVTLFFNADDPLVNVSSPDTTTNTLSVNSPDDDIDTETLEITTIVPTVAQQVGRLPSLSTLSSGVSGTSLATTLEGNSPHTLLAPRDSAFTRESDAMPTNAFDADEDSLSSVLGQLLKYHTIPATVSSGDISDGQTATTLLGDLEVTFEVSGGTVTVNDGRAAVVRPDIPVSDGAVHRIDNLLLPPTALVDFTDRSLPDISTTASDTLVVDGTAFPEGGGFVVLHDLEELQTLGAIPSTVGVSEYVEPGINNEVKVPLNEAISDTTTIVAMPHRDSNDNETYDFAMSGGTQDGPYVLNGSPVTDPAEINVFDPDN